MPLSRQASTQHCRYPSGRSTAPRLKYHLSLLSNAFFFRGESSFVGNESRRPPSSSASPPASTRRTCGWLGGAILACATFASGAEVVGLEAARAFFEAGRLDESKRALEPLAATGAAAAEVNFLRGEIALRENDPESAVTWLEQSVTLAPRISVYHHRLGDAYGRWAQKASIFSALGHARKCLRAYQRAVEIDPDNIAARFSLFTFYRSAPAIIGGGTERAAAEADAIKRLDPDRGRIAWAALHVSQKRFNAARAELAAIQPLDLSTVTRDHISLSDVGWISASVGWGEPARNHMWFDEKNFLGVVLIVHGRLYSKGLYAHSPSRYRFALDGRWKTFAATVGLREGADPSGSAIFIVRADGRELFRSGPLRVDASHRLALNIEGVQELELLTSPGGEKNHFSWAIWVEPTVRR